jgi:hypothetical protein
MVDGKSGLFTRDAEKDIQTQIDSCVAGKGAVERWNAKHLL